MTDWTRMQRPMVDAMADQALREIRLRVNALADEGLARMQCEWMVQDFFRQKDDRLLANRISRYGLSRGAGLIR